MNNYNEKQVAAKATEMLKNAIRGKASRFKDHVNKQEKTAIKAATASAKLNYYKREDGKRGRVGYIRKITFSMGRHGFMQHYGADTLRADHVREEHLREDARGIHYVRSHHVRSHHYHLRPKPFINQAIAESGMTNFVMFHVARIRSEEMFSTIRHYLENPAP